MQLYLMLCGLAGWGGGGPKSFFDFPILIYKCEAEEEKGDGRKQSRWKETEKSKELSYIYYSKGATSGHKY